MRFGRRPAFTSPVAFTPPVGLQPVRRKWRRARALLRGIGWTGRRGWTNRRALAPAYVAAALTVTAAATHAVPDGRRTATGAAVLLVTLAALYAIGRHRKRRTLRPWQLVYLAGTVTTAGLWLVAAAHVGTATAPIPGLLLVWFLGAAIPWWWHHRIRHVDTTIDARVATWRERVACDGGALPGATLENPTPAYADHDNGTRRVIGWTAMVHLPAGRLTSESALHAIKRIASAFQLPLTSVVVEPVADGEHLARLTVYDDNPLVVTRNWAGPHQLDLDTGVATIGTFGDGTRARYRFWRPGSGAVHALVAGASDAGKSRAIDLLLAYERHTPWIASVVIDPQRGQSLPDWRHAVALFADTAERGLVALRAVRDEMYRRNDVLANRHWVDDDGRRRVGMDHYDPAHPVIRDLDLPLICVTVEEAHAVLAIPEARKVVEDIAKMARKCGIVLRLVVQVPLLDQLGGSTTLREQLVAGNVIVLRTANKLTGQVAFNGVLPVDPSQLPREWPDGTTTAGLGYVLGPQARPAPCRIDYVPDAYHWATTGETTELPIVVALYQAYLEAAQPKTTTTVAPAPPAEPGQSALDRIVAYLTEHGETSTGVLSTALGLPASTITTACTRAKGTAVTQPSRGVWAVTPAPAEGTLAPVT